MSDMDAAVEALASTPASQQRLKRQDFTLTNGTPNTRSKIGEYEAELPIVMRQDSLRLMFVVQEQFQTDSNAGNQETFNLSNNIIESANTTDLVLYDSGNRVQPDSVDYGNDSFDYTNPDASADYIHAFYVARNPVKLSIEKASPSAQGGVNDVMYDDVSAILHERDQNQEPPSMDFDHPLDATVPRKWRVEIYQDGPVGFDWDDSDAANSQGVTAVNAIISIPITRAKQDIEGLADAVKARILDQE